LLAGWTSAGFVTIVEDEIRFWNGSKIYPCPCQDPQGVYKDQGAEIHVLLIDEVTHFTENMYPFLRPSGALFPPSSVAPTRATSVTSSSSPPSSTARCPLRLGR